MEVGKTKTKLAEKIEDMLGQGYSCDPEDLRVNKGANVFNDWCSWYGYVKRPDGRKLHVSSWSSMGALLKQEKLTLIMKIEVNTTAKSVEVANCLLRIAIDQLKTNQVAKEHFGLTDADLKTAEKFQKALLKSFLKPQS